MSGFFDMPAGYRDADFEMAALAERGNYHSKMERIYGHDKWMQLCDGETIEAPCKHKDTGELYTVLVRLDDGDRRYSLDGGRWFDTAREAYDA